MEVKREAWRNDSYEEYHTTSLDAIQESGHEFADAGAEIEAAMISCEDAVERKQMLVKLKSAIPKLTPLQQRTLKKIFVLNMSQAELQGKRAFPNRLYLTEYPAYITNSERC